MAKPNKLRKILASIICAEPLYVIGTGTKVLVTHIDYNKNGFDEDRLGGSSKGNEVIARIKFLDVPDKKTIMKCEQFSVDVREVPQVSHNNGPGGGGGSGAVISQPAGYRIDVNSLINIDNLSTTPYETRAAKILYKKS